MMRKLMVFFIAMLVATAAFAQTTIYDIQYVDDPVADDASPLDGETVTVTGFVTFCVVWGRWLQPGRALRRRWDLHRTRLLRPGKRVRHEVLRGRAAVLVPALRDAGEHLRRRE